jgi:tryptophan synthase beta subunit
MVKKANKPNEEYRSFSIEGSSIEFFGGKFISKTPGGAAKKAGRKLYSMIDKEPEFAKYKKDEMVQFIIRETTLGSAHKLFAYDAYKIRLDEPVVRKLPNGGEYTIEFVYKVRALKENELHEHLRSKF